MSLFNLLRQAASGVADAAVGRLHLFASSNGRMATRDENGNVVEYFGSTDELTDAQHGSRGGGTLHAPVVAGGAAGFMSGSDKSKLDGIEPGAGADQTAVEVPFSPAGNIAAANVQLALEELDAEKAASGHTHVLADITDSGALAAKDTIGTPDIDPGAVTYSRLQDVSATDRILGRDTAGAGVVEELSPTAVRGMLNVEDGATADQTPAEIKTAYESNADTNAFTDAEKTKVGHLAVTAATDLDAIRTRVNELDAAVVLVGEWDASVGSFPAGAQAGESWIVNADGTVDGVEFRVGDRIIALADSASTTIYAGNWIKADYTDRVSTVHGRTGAVVGQSGDYDASQVTNDSGVSGADVAAALDALDAAKANSADLGALASKDTVGTADIDNAAATNAKLANMAANTIKARLAGSGAPQDVAIAANRLLARASTGDLEAKELTDFALSLLDDADAATMRTTLGLGSMSTQSASAVAITGGSIAGTNLNTQTADLETMIAQGL